MHKELQYMATFLLPEEPSDEFLNLLPEQDEQVEQYISSGVLSSYALSTTNARLWAVFNVSSELEAREFIAALPLTPFMQVELILLHQYSAASAGDFGFSLN